MKQKLRTIPTLWRPSHSFLFSFQKTSPFGGLVSVDALTGEHEFFLDPKGQDVNELSGVTYFQGKLYFGRLKNDYIAVYTL